MAQKGAAPDRIVSVIHRLAVAPESLGRLLLEALQRNLPRIGAPFPNVADHLIQAVTVGLITLAGGRVEVAVCAQLVIGEIALPNVTLVRALPNKSSPQG